MIQSKTLLLFRLTALLILRTIMPALPKWWKSWRTISLTWSPNNLSYLGSIVSEEYLPLVNHEFVYIASVFVTSLLLHVQMLSKASVVITLQILHENCLPFRIFRTWLKEALTNRGLTSGLAVVWWGGPWRSLLSKLLWQVSHSFSYSLNKLETCDAFCSPKLWEDCMRTSN